MYAAHHQVEYRHEPLSPWYRGEPAAPKGEPGRAKHL
jgi:hypothetical protein